LGKVGKHNFNPAAFKRALGSLIGMPEIALRFIAVTDDVGQYPGDPTAASRSLLQRELAESRSAVFDYVTSMNASLVVFSERWELRLILERLVNVLEMRVSGTGSPCYAGSAASRNLQGTPVCQNITLIPPTSQLSESVHHNASGQNLLQSIRAAGMLASFVAVLPDQAPVISSSDAGPDIFYRPAVLEFSQELDYSSNLDSAGETFWWAGERFPVAPVVLIRDRHGRHVEDVTPDTQITVSLNEAEFPATVNPVTKEIIRMNPTRIVGPSTKLYLQGEAAFDRIYISSTMNSSRLHFNLETNPFANDVPELKSAPLNVRVRPAVVVIIPPPVVTHPALILFGVGVVLVACLCCLVRVCKARMWCRVPESEKRGGRTKIKPSFEPQMETRNYATHDVEKETGDEEKAAVTAALEAQPIESKATPYKNNALDSENYSELVARLPKVAKTKAVGQGMFYIDKPSMANPSDGELVSSNAVTSAAHVFSHRAVFDSVAALEKARRKIEGTPGEDPQLSGRMPTGTTARSEGPGEGALSSIYNSIGVVLPKRRQKQGVMGRLFGRNRADDKGPHPEFDLMQPAEVCAVVVRPASGGSNSRNRSVFQLGQQGSSRRNAIARQGSTSSLMSAGGISDDDFGGTLEQIARGPLCQDIDGTGIVQPSSSDSPKRPRLALMRSASSMSVRNMNLPTVNEG
jgi:hypothetical protein